MRNNLIASRLRIARNIADYPFTQMMTKSTSQRMIDDVEKILGNMKLISDMNVLDTQYLLERGTFSKEMLSFSLKRGIINENKMCLLVNEEDHMRFLKFKVGDLTASEIQESIQWSVRVNESFEYAYDEQMGFLTASVLNVGTGMKYSKLIHLPALVNNKYIDRVRYTASQLGITINDYKNSSNGNLFIIGNLKTLGVSEEEIVATVDRVCEQLLKLEMEAERKQYLDHQVEFENRIFRSFGMLKYSRMISMEEAFSNLSDILMGINLNLIGCSSTNEIKELFFQVFEASINKSVGKILSVKERQTERANIVRKVLEGTYEIQS